MVGGVVFLVYFVYLVEVAFPDRIGGINQLSFHVYGSARN